LTAGWQHVGAGQKQAALAFCDRPPTMPEVPWFWTDQYDIRLMIAKSLTPDRDCIRSPYVSPKALALNIKRNSSNENFTRDFTIIF